MVVGGLLLTFGSTVHFSAGRLFWSDELFGWMLLRDPSLSHMLAAWRAGADGGGLLFYLLGRVWFAAFGPTELSFRLFSAAGFYLGWIVLWLALRRRYKPWLIGTVMVFVWFSSMLILQHLIEGRFYGLLLGACALSFLAARLALDTATPSAWVLLLLFLSNLLLVGTHPLGIFYSAALLVAVALADSLARRFRPLVYLATVLGWSVLLLSLDALRNSAAVGKPHFWTTRPGKRDLLRAYAQNALPIPALLIFAVLVVVLAIASHRVRVRDVAAQISAKRAVLLPGVAILAVPFVIWVYSRHGTSVFVDRYLIPMEIGEVIVFVELLTLALLLPRWPTVLRSAAAALVLVFCAGVVTQQLRTFPESAVYPPHDYTASLASQLPDQLPVVFERVDIFDVMTAYRRTPQKPMYYLLDWETAMAPESPLGDVSGYHEMANWKKVGYFSGSILNSEDFLARFNDFVVCDDRSEKWFERRILNQPQWTLSSLGEFVPQGQPAEQVAWGCHLWRVQRKIPPIHS